jgi:hypothetical protein
MLTLALLFACAPKVSPESEAPVASAPVAPDAEQREHIHTEHDVERSDPYYWMRDREDPAVVAYVEAENSYTEAMTAHTADWRDSLAKEMLGRIQETDTDVPIKHGEWLYYDRTEEGLAYQIHCRKKGQDGEEQVILDENLAERSNELGNWFMDRLRAIDSPHVEEVRGKGLMIGVVIKASSGTARPFCEALEHRGILAKETHSQVIRFAPPLVIGKDVLEDALEEIGAVLSA